MRALVNPIYKDSFVQFVFQVADGVNSIIVGELGGYDKPLAFVGGNCSIQGFDVEGNDEFWTVR